MNERVSDWICLNDIAYYIEFKYHREREREERESLSMWGKIFHKDWDICFAQAVKGKCHLFLSVSFCTTSSGLQWIMQESVQLTRMLKISLDFLSTKNDAFKAMTFAVVWFTRLFQHLKFWCYSKRNYKTVLLPWLLT